MIANLRDPTYIAALVYFERAAARLSFALAAEDLAVTPSAISHRIASLEAALGHRLFERRPRQVVLTQEGHELALIVNHSLSALRDVTETLISRQGVRVSIGPYLSSNWLMPRLAEFETAHPQIRVDLLHRAGWPDLKEVDFAIVWHKGEPKNCHAQLLFDSDCIMVVAGGSKLKGPIWESGLQPLHYKSRDLWRQWLTQVGGPIEYANLGEVFDDPILILEASAYKRGVAVGFLPFITQQLATGRLEPVSAEAFSSDSSYWLVSNSELRPAASLFQAWIKQQINESDSQLSR